MAVSKRLRYEVLRRDNHACRYCGQSAPDVKLTVDHVIPTTLGGGDDPGNLVTACADCNSGKSATPPEAPLIADVAERAAHWAQAMRIAAIERQIDREKRAEIDTWFVGVWNNWTFRDWRTNEYHPVPLLPEYSVTIHRFLSAGLNIGDLEELVDAAMAGRNTKERWRYFCGCCWTRIRQAQKRAAELAEQYEQEASRG